MNATSYKITGKRHVVVDHTSEPLQSPAAARGATVLQRLQIDDRMIHVSYTVDEAEALIASLSAAVEIAKRPIVFE